MRIEVRDGRSFGFIQYSGECFNYRITSALRTADSEALQ